MSVLPALPTRLAYLLVVVLGVLLLPAAAGAVTISGTAMKDELGTSWQGCSTATNNVGLAVNGVAQPPTSCNRTTGAFTFSGVTVPSVGAPIAIWFDTTSSAGVLYTTAASTSANIAGLTPTQDRVWIRSEQASPTLTETLVQSWDAPNDPQVPVDGTGDVTAAGLELHIDSGVTFSLSNTFSFIGASLHVEPGGTFAPDDQGDGTTIVSGNGTQACDKGPGIARPVCIEPGGAVIDTPAHETNWEYSGQDGRFAIEPMTVGSVVVNGSDSSIGEIGYAAAQTLTVREEFGIKSPVTSDPWGVTVNAGSVWLDSWTGLFGNGASWTGSSTFTITVDWQFSGDGPVDLPGATLMVATTGGRADIGPDQGLGPGGISRSPDWNFRSIDVRNGGYIPTAYGGGATGMSTPVDYGATENIVAMANNSASTYAVVQLSQNGGDWGIIRYDTDGTIDSDWDDGDANAVDNDGNAVLVFGTAGADIPWAAAVASSGPLGSDELMVVGASAGDWMLRMYDADGRPVNAFSGDGVDTWNPGGTDEARAVSYDGTEILVAGTGGATPAWQLREWSRAGATTAHPAFTNGGVAANVTGMCRAGDNVYVVGTVGAAGSRDWAAKRYDDGTSSWTTFNGIGAGSAWTWNPGGTEDAPAGCTTTDDDSLVIAGTTGPATNDDGRVRSFDLTGAPDLSYGVAGVASFAGTGDDDVYAIAAAGAAEGGVIVAGRDTASGGTAVMRRFDPDGALDTSWGTTGVMSYDNGAGTDESARALATEGDGTLRAGVRVGTASGDVALRRYDYAGTLMTTTASSVVRVLVHNAWDGRSRITAGTSVDLGVGSAGDNVLLDLESYDTRLESKGTLIANIRGWIRASSTEPLISHNDMYLNGSFWANLGEVRMESREFRAELHYANNLHLSRVTVDAGEKQMTFENGKTLFVDDQLTLRGTSCTSPAFIAAGPSSAVYDIVVPTAADFTMQYVDLSYMRVNIPVTANSSRSVTTNTNVTFASPCAGSANRAPNGLMVEGAYHNRQVTSPTFSMAMYNRMTSAVDRGDVEIVSSPLSNQLALWRFDGTLADSAGVQAPLVPNSPAVYSSATAGRFANAAVISGTHGGFDAGDLDLTGDFTIDGWVNTTLATADPAPDLIYKGNGTGSLINYRLGFERGTSEFVGELTTSGGNSSIVSIPQSEVADGTWHHVGLVQHEGRIALYVDGRLRGTDANGGSTVDVGTWSTTIGYKIGGSMDDWRISSVAYSPDEINGFYRTGRRHADVVWDADPADSTGVPLGFCGSVAPGTAPPCAAGVRSGFQYAGPAGSLNMDGARYWMRERVRTQAGSVWSNWSDYDWFDTAQTMTASVTSGPTVSLGGPGALAGVDAVGTATFQATTTNAHGYTMYVSGPSDTWGMSDGIALANHTIPGRGTAGTPTSWPAGTAGFFGVSVLSATGGKDTTRWGAGTDTSNLGALNWGWGSRSTPLMLHTRAAFDPAAQQVQLAVRANPGALTDPGRYTTTLVLTAVPNV
ncbi:MAG: Laminin sub domain 2 [Thermoleophilia bacterium]|nr:Laminin sub domain 2 [Thermoleophilia bacterium]